MRIDVLTGERRGLAHEGRGTTVVLGRGGDCEVALGEREARVSSRHAELAHQDGRWLVRDLGSTNGTFLRGRRVTVPTPVNDGDTITLGRGGVTVRVSELGGSGRKTEVATGDSGDSLGVGRTTLYATMMRESLRRHSQRFWLIMGGSAIVILAVAAFFVERLRKQKQDSDAGTAQALQAAEAATSLASTERRKGDAPGRVARRLENAVFMIVADVKGVTEPFCSAFALRADGWLGTNAHCGRLIDAVRTAGGSVRALMNHDPGRSYSVGRVIEHPDYIPDESKSADLALIKVDLGVESLPKVVHLAPLEELHKIVEGATIVIMGFPKQLAEATAPAADVRLGRVTRVTSLVGDIPANVGNRLLWFDVATTHGTSGSPILDAGGRLIAINSGGNFDEVRTVDPDTQAVKDTTIYHPYNYGVRADALDPLLSQLSDESL